ncbi:MAG: HEAT repeat domain-containing protein, partial [Planctomycetota bacterium]
LAILAKDSSENVRASAAYAYGLMGSVASRKAIRALLYGDTFPDVRVRAIEGLAESCDPAAVDLLIGVFERETDVRVRAAAASGVVAMETPALVRKLLLRLEHTEAASPERVALVNVLARFQSDEPLDLLRAVLRGDDVVSADAAALGLARRWDASAMVQLIQMTEAGRSARSAVRGLQVLTSQEFEAESYDRQAGNYKAWYQTHSTGNPRSWFSEALTERGYDTSSMNDLAATEETQVEDIRDDTVELLLTALRDKAWFIRRNASHLLSKRMGEGAPDEINYLTRPTEMEETIGAFHDWWAKVVAERERERRG